MERNLLATDCETAETITQDGGSLTMYQKAARAL